MKGIWWFIGVIVLVSIIFGVSLHDSFWGIIAFIGGAVALLLALGAIAIGADKLMAVAGNKAKTQKSKTKKQKEEELNSILQGVFAFTMTLAVIAVIAAIFSFALYGDLSFGFGH